MSISITDVTLFVGDHIDHGTRLGSYGGREEEEEGDTTGFFMIHNMPTSYTILAVR